MGEVSSNQIRDGTDAHSAATQRNKDKAAEKCLDDVGRTPNGERRAALASRSTVPSLFPDEKNCFNNDKLNEAKPEASSQKKLDFSFSKKDANDLADNTRMPGVKEEFKEEGGKRLRRREDGAECTYGVVTKADGTSAERIEKIAKTDGSSRVFKYENAGDPTLATGWTDKVKAAYGKGEEITDQYTRINSTDKFICTQADGKTFRMDKVEIDKAGQVTYNRADESLVDRAVTFLFGENRLTSGDYEAAKQHLLSVANGRLFGSNERLEKYLDAIADRIHEQGKHGVKQPSDDQIASTFKWIAKMYETDHSQRSGVAASLSENHINRAGEELILTLWSPDKGNNQAQIGSCYLNSLHYIAEVGSPDKIAQAYANIFTHGSYKGYKFDKFDVSPASGQNIYNHTMASLLAKPFGYNHVSSAFPGTATFQAQKAFMAIFGSKFPVFTLGSRISKAVLDKAIEEYGAVSMITHGMAHAEALSKDNQGHYKRANWWSYNQTKYGIFGLGPLDGPMSERQLNLRT